MKKYGQVKFSKYRIFILCIFFHWWMKQVQIKWKSLICHVDGVYATHHQLQWLQPVPRHLAFCTTMTCPEIRKIRRHCSLHNKGRATVKQESKERKWRTHSGRTRCPEEMQKKMGVNYYNRLQAGKKKQGTNRRSISMQAKIINQNSEMRGYDAFLSKPLRLRHR